MVELPSTFYNELYDQFARIGKAVSNGHRIALLEFLAQGERCVESLAQLSELSVANTSRHLQHLKEAGLVRTRKDGQFVYYRLADDDVLRFLKVLRDLAEQERVAIARLVDTYLRSKDELEPVSVEELLDRAREGVSVTLLDVRPRDEYEAGHIDGARNVQLEDLEQEFAGENEPIGKDALVVAYCRGPYCMLSYEAVEKLRQLGYNARRLKEGYPEWKLAGYPIHDNPRSSGACH